LTVSLFHEDSYVALALMNKMNNCKIRTKQQQKLRSYGLAHLSAYNRNFRYRPAPQLASASWEGRRHNYVNTFWIYKVPLLAITLNYGRIDGAGLGKNNSQRYEVAK
jgi:hypothetical protein